MSPPMREAGIVWACGSVSPIQSPRRSFARHRAHGITAHLREGTAGISRIGMFGNCAYDFYAT